MILKPLISLALAALIGLSACSSQSSKTEDKSANSPRLSADTNPAVTIYTAKHILTMDSKRPGSEAIAVSASGKIMALGTLNALMTQYKNAVHNTQFEQKTLIPGLIDPHVHMTLGAMMYGLDFIPPWNMESPDGTVKALSSKTALLGRISLLNRNKPAQSDTDPLFLYGYHNLVQGDLTRQDLDSVTTARPLIIWHFSGHDFYLNSKAIETFKLTPDLADKFHGVDLDAKGALTGRIYEDALLALFPYFARYLMSADHIAKGFNGFERLLKRSGVTTIAELGYGIFGRQIEDSFLAAHYTDDDAYRLYLVPEHRAFHAEFGAGSVQAIQDMVADKSRIAPVLPQVKLFSDAAFYSQTMKLTAPGYIDGQSRGTDGLWVTYPDALPDLMARYWDAGLDIHIHSNGDAAQTSTLNALAAQKPAQAGQRLIIEHAGLLTPEQLDKAGKLGVGLSAASHYVHYMGTSYSKAIGDRVKYITPLASALERGLPVTLHSDAPLAPPQPLRAASVHMTRSTREGGISTPDERLTAMQALRSVTLDAAWSLGLENQIGSLEVGKRADFTVLDRNPITTQAQDWPQIQVWGVVIDGKLHPVDAKNDSR